MFEKQALHFIFLGFLLAGVLALARGNVLTGQLWGIGTPTWLMLAIAVPIVHQIFVWFVWRVELHHQLWTRWFGDKSFLIYGIGFMLLFIARPLSLIALAFANRGTLALNPFLAYLLATLLLIPSLYAMVSVGKYFGLKRALGIDHFNPAYREIPFIKQGIFKYTSNGMYKFAFLLLWALGLLFLSEAALLAAAFSHFYIWVHYYCTELPDIRRIYDSPSMAG
jgi:hypothetical protein